MRFIQKIFYIFISLFFLYFLINLILNTNENKQFINKIVNNWLLIVIPSISISYISGLFIYNFPLISIILYPILKPVYHFENQKSCSLFLISLIIGEPSITKLIIFATKNNEISINEGNRLMRFTAFISPIFLITILDYYIAVIVIITEIIVNTIIAHISKNYLTLNNKIENNSFFDVYFNIINDLPSLLLGILSTMIITSLFMYNINIPTLNIYFEITNGILTLKNNINNLINFVVLQSLVSFNGLAIILQVFWLIKKTKLLFNNFILYRIIANVITLLVSSIIYLFIFFF